MDGWANLWSATDSSNEESETELTDCDIEEVRPRKSSLRTQVLQLPWPASRLPEKGITIPGGDTPNNLIPGDSQEADYASSADDNTAVNEREYQHILRRRAAMNSAKDEEHAEEEEEAEEEEPVEEEGENKEAEEDKAEEEEEEEEEREEGGGGENDEEEEEYYDED